MPTIDEEVLGLRTKYIKDNNLALIRAIVGDASGNVPADIPGWVWVRVQSSNGLSDKRRVLPPAGKAMNLKAGAAVTLEYDKMGNLRIAEPDTQTDLSGGVNVLANIVQPGATPRMTQGSIETLRVVPTNPASLMVGVKGWGPIVGATAYQFAGAAVDLTSHVPASGDMCYAVIFVKSDYTTTEAFASTARSTADVPLDAADIQECISAATAGSTPVWAIKLVGGQTTITQDNIDVDGVDLRQMVNTASSAGAAYYQTVQAGGMDLTQRDKLNIYAGTGISISAGDSASPSVTSLQILAALGQSDLPAGIPLKVKNTSGATANANDVGYLDYDGSSGYVYKTTTTANLEATWCVVVTGAANNSDIYVARRGQVTVKLNANCSVGDYLTTSTTAGQAAVNTGMRPEVFAVALTANVSGAGGTCTAMLLCNTRFVPFAYTEAIYSLANHTDTDFVATINGAPTATSVVYNAPSAGTDDNLPPQYPGNLGRLCLINTDRGNSVRFIEACNTGTKTITTTSSTDSWASGDTITIRSQVAVQSGLGCYLAELDMSHQTIIPTLARAFAPDLEAYDSASNWQALFVHPYEAYGGSKLEYIVTQVGGVAMKASMPAVKIINRRFAFGQESSGASTANLFIRTFGYWLAEP